MNAEQTPIAITTRDVYRKPGASICTYEAPPDNDHLMMLPYLPSLVYNPLKKPLIVLTCTWTARNPTEYW